MSTKADIIEQLTNAGIEHDPSATKADLEALLPDGGGNGGSESRDGIKISDPKILRPADLPLVLEPEDGEWKNEAQARYAKTLNAYAYKNPTKWEIKKDKLIAQLVEIGKNPAAISKYQGNAEEGVKYSDKRLQA